MRERLALEEAYRRLAATRLAHLSGACRAPAPPDGDGAATAPKRSTLLPRLALTPPRGAAAADLPG